MKYIIAVIQPDRLDEVRKRLAEKEIPLVLDQEAVLWIAGLRLSERVKITENTRQILKVKFV